MQNILKKIEPSPIYMGGSIKVESKVGEGTTFTLEFPVAVAQEARA